MAMSSVRLSQPEYARLLGVSQPAISKALRAGRIYDAGDGIDPYHPASMLYAQESAERVARLDPSRPPSPWARGERPAETSEPRVPGPAIGQRIGAPKLQKKINGNAPGASPEVIREGRERRAAEVGIKEIERSRKAIALQNDKINYLTKIGKLVRGDDYDRSISRIAAVIGEHFRTFADRHADQLAAMAKAGAERAQFADYLDAEIDKAMTAVQQTCDREIRERADRCQVEAETSRAASEPDPEPEDGSGSEENEESSEVESSDISPADISPADVSK
jgi:hypothetical protein